MVGKPTKAEKKIASDAKSCQLLEDYTQILVVAADNVGSNQLQNIRKGLRGDSVVLMGNNTMMKRSVRIHAEKTGNNVFLNLIPLFQGGPFLLCYMQVEIAYLLLISRPMILRSLASSTRSSLACATC